MEAGEPLAGAGDVTPGGDQGRSRRRQAGRHAVGLAGLGARAGRAIMDVALAMDLNAGAVGLRARARHFTGGAVCRPRHHVSRLYRRPQQPARQPEQQNQKTRAGPQ